ncbi:metallophosphoesterase family protein [Catalinimonas niigatensis]|uniref:metallophosphoesterase family protein n=1 Tax=Catalinimonas niigatensis TaxID=1397264 RepID=UPI002666A358|nr:metallophosphoesterase [Catalinimonas niigatensis]WPP49896.1 metallophosphoesterase [Catalinimonas niigatensis]
MPGFFYQAISRKTFIKQTASLLGAVSVGSSFFAHAASPTQELHYALLSDTHVAADKSNEYRRFFPYQNLQKVVAQLSSMQHEGIIINGDVARLEGKEEDYQQVKALLSPLSSKVPIHIGMGNHDDRAPFFSVFPADDPSQVEDKHVSVIESDPVRIIILDSLLYVNKVAGLLGKSQRSWLESYLKSSDEKPTVLFVHHTLEDRDSDLLDAERMFDVIRPHQKVKAVFYGHSHRYHIEEKEGIYLVNLPAIGYNFTDDQPIGWVDALFTPSGVGLKLHAIGGNPERDGEEKTLQWRA